MTDRKACNDKGVRLHQNADGNFQEPSLLLAQPYRRAKEHSMLGQAHLQCETNQDRRKQPDPSHERLYLYAQTSRLSVQSIPTCKVTFQVHPARFWVSPA